MNCITYSAPGRVDISGGAADIFGGCTISVAVDLRATCTVSPGSGTPTLRTETGIVDLVDPPNAPYELMTSIAAGYGIRDVSLQTSSEIPRSSGLGGSASLAVAALSALNAWNGWGYHAYGIAERAQRIETQGMDLVNGYQDQYAAVFGSCLFMDFSGKGNRPLGEEPYAVVEHLEFPYPLVIAHTGTSHNSGASNSGIVQKYYDRDPLVYGRIQELNAVTRALRTDIINGSYNKICDAMQYNQDVIRDFKRSYPENERLIAAALDAGADAAKVTGAGCGGSIAALCSDEDSAKTVEIELARLSAFSKVCHADDGVMRHV